MYPSSSISQMSLLSFLNNEARYRARIRPKIAKKAHIRARRPGRAFSSFRGESDLKIARRIEVLISLSRRPILRFTRLYGDVRG
jgi:hypothetical protein